jgi:allantoate deiminase
METNLKRIKEDIEKISNFNATPGHGITRFSYSPEDKQAREYFMQQFKQLGLRVKVDGVGNIRARLEGTDPDLSVVMSGSHIDTVLHGGKFDGMVGSVGALEAVRTLVDNKIKTKHPVEVVIFAEEEGSNFGSSMAGSKAMIGKYKLKDIKSIKNDKGISMYDMARNFGLDPDKVEMDVIKPDEIKAMIELHVEQGGILDDEKISVGIVEAIAGSKWFKIEFEGVPNHAGATPMHLRRDPMVAASKVIAEVEKITKQKAFSTTVGTVGKIICQPNIPNCIPEKVIFTVDIRDVYPKGIEIVANEVKKIVEAAAKENKVKSSMELMGESDAIKLSKNVVDLIEEKAVKLGVDHRRMNSGAVHDSSLLAGVTDVGMIFVPSINGRSHVPEEKTDFEDIKLGCDLLLAAILDLAN